MEMVRAKKDDIHNLATLVQLAPFIDADLIEELGADLVPSHIGEVVELSPFATNELCARWIEKLESMENFDLDVGLLSELGPYLSQEKMDQLSERVIPDSLIALDSVAPFLSTDALSCLAERVEHITLNDYLVGMERLLQAREVQEHALVGKFLDFIPRGERAVDRLRILQRHIVLRHIQVEMVDIDDIVVPAL